MVPDRQSRELRNCCPFRFYVQALQLVQEANSCLRSALLRANGEIGSSFFENKRLDRLRNTSILNIPQYIQAQLCQYVISGRKKKGSNECGFLVFPLEYSSVTKVLNSVICFLAGSFSIFQTL
jgi:hypothetical protein